MIACLLWKTSSGGGTPQPGRVCGGDSSLVVSTAQKELFDERLLLVLDEWHALATFTAAMFFHVVDGVRMTVGWRRFLAMVPRRWHPSCHLRLALRHRGPVAAEDCASDGHHPECSCTSFCDGC